MAGVAIAMALIGTASSIQSAQAAKGSARQQEKLQKEQSDLQARMDLIKRQRATRKRKAQIYGAQAASGAETSTSFGSIAGIDSGFAFQSDINNSQLDLQKQQFSIARQQTVDSANAQIAQSIGSFAQTAFTPQGVKGQSLYEMAVS